MGSRIIIIFSCLFITGSNLYSQSLINRLRVPITIKGKMGVGYDNNILRFSDKEIREDNITIYGITNTLDSYIMKPFVTMIYSPAIIDGKTTNIVASISYNYFGQAQQKSYIISNLYLEIRLKSYSWFKIGVRDIPKYYLRNYHDHDISNIDYYSCSFSSQEYFASYSLPIKWIRRTWMKISTHYTKEYYNPHFTEFDLDKYMVQFDLNRRTREKHRMKLSVAHGVAVNRNYGSYLPSTSFDRSYVFDKLRSEFVYKNRNDNIFNQFGISFLLEQRYYELESMQYSFDNWKFYLDGRAKVWIDWDIMDTIGMKTFYQFRWRNANSQIYSDFDWVEDIKSYTKHEIWVEFSYEFITDILY